MSNRREPTWEDDVLPVIRRQVVEALFQGLEPYQLRITDGALCLFQKWCDRYERIFYPKGLTLTERLAFLQDGVADPAFESVVIQALDVPAIVDSRRPGAKPDDTQWVTVLL